MKTKTAKTRERVMQGVFTACACISILAVALICIFLFANGLPTIFKIGPLNFLLGLRQIAVQQAPDRHIGRRPPGTKGTKPGYRPYFF